MIARLTAISRVRLLGVAILVIGAVIVATVPAWGSDYDLLVAYEIAQLAALALAWNLMAGYGGLVSLAVAAFVGIGSYATAKLSISAGFGLLPSILMGGAFAIAFALLVAVPMFRFRGLYFTIGSLVLASALGVFMVNYNGLGGNAGLTLTNVAPTAAGLYRLALACALIAMLATAIVVRGRLGLGLMAVRDDEDVAERVGVATFRTKLVSFVLSAFVMGLIGGIQAQKLGHIEPYGSFSLNWTINAVNAAIIGGIGTILGPVVGAAVIVELSERLANYPETHLAIIGALLILIIRFAPAGVWGSAVLLWRRFVPLEVAGRRSQVAGEAQPIAPRGSPGSVLLRASGLGKAYGGVRAVDSVSLEVRSGEVLGVIGPNGAGKSTLIGLVSGAIHGDGRVELFGEDATGLGAQGRARRGIGRTHQVPRPFSRLTVLENLLVAQMHGAGRGRAAARAEAMRILERCGLEQQADTPAADLGLLRLKRLELARALAVHPRILLLDEIGAGLIESELQELIELINSLRGEVEAIVVVEHILDLIREICDRVLVVDRGRALTEGEPDEVLRDPQVATVYLGTSGGEDVGHVGDRARRRDVPLLEVRGVAAQYGAFRALQDVSLTVGEGEVFALLGANGAGKTTTARAVSGMLPISAGEIRFAGKRLDGRRPHDIVRTGIAHCMEGRRIFADLSVEENLLLGGRTASSRGERERLLAGVYDLFSDLKDRRSNSGAELSGGQQQMLAIGRALMAAPRLIVFDEISLGLAPIVIDRLYEALAEINSRGVAMIVIEQNVERGLALADRVAVLEKGRVALSGTPSEVRGDPRLLALYVGEARGAVA
jgi:ABC-type branched-subunit amino acid transport system ATPase component/ABC-type branched-subunit amino acid transport system permease subunit